MAILYSLHLSTSRRGFGKPSVHATEAGLVGHWFDGKPMTPDRDAVREALPHYYRKAFDRSGPFWFPSNGDKPAHVTLRNSRGRWLNVLYAIPYRFEPKARL